MPELPEVETFRRTFERHAVGRTLTDLALLDRGVLGALSARSLIQRTRGRVILSSRRHGKVLFGQLGPDLWLVLRFGMTGSLEPWRRGEPEPRFARVVFSLSGGVRLAFVDARKLGRVELARSPEAYVVARKLGPDALELSWPAFRARARDRRGPVKGFLMNQRATCRRGEPLRRRGPVSGGGASGHTHERARDCCPETSAPMYARGVVPRGGRRGRLGALPPPLAPASSRAPEPVPRMRPTSPEAHLAGKDRVSLPAVPAASCGREGGAVASANPWHALRQAPTHRASSFYRRHIAEERGHACCSGTRRRSPWPCGSARRRGRPSGRCIPS